MKKVVAGLLLMFAAATSFLVLNPLPTSTPRDTVYALRALRGGGSGVLIAPNIMLTAAHVADSGRQLFVDYKGYQVPVSTKIIKIDYEQDLALIQVLGIDCPCASIAGDVNLDEAVTAVGFPLLITEVATKGNYQGDANHDDKLFAWFTTLIAPGNSGGGVFNSKGELVGITVGVPTIPLGMFGMDLALYLGASPTLKNIQTFLKDVNLNA